LPEAAVVKIVARLGDTDPYVRDSAANGLGCQSSLPSTAIDALLNSSQVLNADGRVSNFSTSSRFEGFLPFVPGLHISLITNLLEAWLWGEFLVYFSDTDLCGRGPGTQSKLPLELRQKSDLQEFIVTARKNLSLPISLTKRSLPNIRPAGCKEVK
jgi:hypothetical protein